MDNSNLYSEDDEFAVPETQESPATFSKNIIRKLGIRRTSSGTDAADPNSNTNVTNMDEAAGPSGLSVASSRQLANQALQYHLINPLRRIFKDKARASAKCEYLRNCIAKKSYPKGTIPLVPLKIQDAPEDLTREWNTILQDCARNLTQTLAKFHHDQIVHQEQLAEGVITDASHLIIPEHILNVPDIPAQIESTIQGLLCESSLLSTTLRKRTSKGKSSTAKRAKITKTIPIPQSLPTTSTEALPGPSTSSSSIQQTPSSKNDKRSWRPLKLKKQKK